MERTAVSFGCVTISLDDELLIIRVDGSCLPPAKTKPSLHRAGLGADHLTIPLKPRAHGRDAGTYWIHLTYPDKSHKAVAAIHPDSLERLGQLLQDSWSAIIPQFLQRLQEVDAKWLEERGYKVLFTHEDELPTLIDTHFRQKKRHYRVSEVRLHRAAEDMWIADPAILDDDDFLANSPDQIQAVQSDSDDQPLTILRLPTDPGSTPRWYLAPPNHMQLSVLPGLIESFSRAVGPGVWDHVRTILIELGVYDALDDIESFLAALKSGELLSYEPLDAA
jgi:hypothetical protein